MAVILSIRERRREMEHKVDVDEWIARFRVTGLDDVAMKRWHTLFEQENPEGHQSFLEWLGLPADRIGEIRRNAA
jgi:hypothetical protein